MHSCGADWASKLYNTDLINFYVVCCVLCYNLQVKKQSGLSGAASLLKAELNARFKKFEDPSQSDFDSLFVIATALDPRFRLVLSEEQKEAGKQAILAKLRELREANEDSPMDVGECASSNGSTGGELQPPLKRFKHLSAVVKERKREEKRREKTEPAPEAVEVEQYFRTTYQVNDPVQFWVEHEGTFPILAPFAIDLLVIPASSAPVERVFSTAGIITSGRRNRLTGFNLEREVFIKRNKKYL